MMIKLILKRGKEESLGRLHPWVFSGAIHHIEGNPVEGDLVDIYSAQNEWICRGHWQIGSIAVRVLTFDDCAIDEAFYRERLTEAFEMRCKLNLVRDNAEDNAPINNAYRLVHGEGDFLPGLVIDIYAGTAVMQAHSVGMHVDREKICRALCSVPGLQLKAVYYKSETTLPFKANLGQENGFIFGAEADIREACENNVAIENGLKFHIDWLKGQKTGFFIDQRENRALLESFSRGKRVLNMFCYTGGFSVYAMRGGAEVVHSVDSSAKAVNLVNANIALNFPGDARHKAFAQDAFEYLDQMQHGAYDLIILDPPAFAKHRDALRHALKGYAKLNAKAFSKIKHGGVLFTFSCSQAVDKEHFRTAVFTAAAMSGRKVRILHQIHQPSDHPINIYHPEGEYLKGLVLYVE